MSKKVLLIDANYQVQSFIDLRKAVKHIVNKKVEIISVWEDDYLYFGNGNMSYPAVLKLNRVVNRNFISTNFSRGAIFKRDGSRCQYCNKKLSASNMTIDHVLPRSRGGTNSFTNCVVACHFCNNKKANQTPEEAGMPLLRIPTHPIFTSFVSIQHPSETIKNWHSDWNNYLSY